MSEQMAENAQMPTDAEIDWDLRLEGFNADEPYPEHGHEALRTAYRSGFKEAMRRIASPPGESA